MADKQALCATDRMERAFFELLETQHYSKISVTQLIRKAGVSRTTFYRKYDDIFDMYKKVCDHLLEELLDIAVPLFTESDLTDARMILDDFYNHLNQQQKYIQLLCSYNGDRYFFIRILEIGFEIFGSFSDRFSQEDIIKFKFAMLAGLCSYAGSLHTETQLSDQILANCKKVFDLSTLHEETDHGN